MASTNGWHIRTTDVRKRYRGAAKDAVHHLDLTVQRGTVFGILGPNGAGKTTTLSLLCGLLEPDSGRIEFAGARSAAELRQRIGLVPQNVALYPRLNARENLWFFGNLYGVRGARARRRCEELLELVGLTERADDRTDTYSSGMQRRLNLAAGLMHEPEMVLLDEPTVGIDPQSRNRVFELVEQLKHRGVTVLYTTHYMEEAQRLCDRVAIMDHGAVIVEDQPQELVASHGNYQVHFRIDGFPQALADALDDWDAVVQVSAVDGILALSTDDGQGALAVLEGTRALAERHGVSLSLRSVTEANLESVFLQLTGRSLRDEID